MPALDQADAAIGLHLPRLPRGSAVAGTLDWLRRALLPFALLVGVWWVLKLVLRLDSTILPSPLETASSAVPLLQRGILVDYVTNSLERIAVASLLGVAVAVPVGLILGCSRWLSIAFRPYLTFFQALSGIAWLPIVLV